MKMKFNKRSFFGSLGVVFYYILSLPFIRSVLFGDKAKVLDAFSGEVVVGTDLVKVVGQSILFIPYVLNTYIFSNFEFNNLNFLVLLIMSPVVYRYFSFSKGFYSFFLLLFLFFPAPLLFLSTFTKDTMLVFFLFISYGYYKNLQIRNNYLYFTLYALLMRPYLFWVPLVVNSKNITRALFGVSFIFILFLQFEITSDVIYRIFNRRLVETLYVANSKIDQTVIVRDSFDIIAMIFEVFPQIFFPVFYDFGLKTCILQVYILLIVLISILKRNSYSNVLLLLMVLYAVLDPDLGAYFRHLSSFFIFFPILLGLNRHVKNPKDIST